MRIECPDCAAVYEVPEPMLSPGRPVRCARCGSDWVPIPEAAPAFVPETLAPETLAAAASPAKAAVPEPEDEPLEPASPALPVPFEPAPTIPAEPPRRFPWALAFAWVLSVAVLAAAAVAAYAQREAIMRVWPPSERAYALLGLAPRR